MRIQYPGGIFERPPNLAILSLLEEMYLLIPGVTDHDHLADHSVRIANLHPNKALIGKLCQHHFERTR